MDATFDDRLVTVLKTRQAVTTTEKKFQDAAEQKRNGDEVKKGSALAHWPKSRTLIDEAVKYLNGRISGHGMQLEVTADEDSGIALAKLAIWLKEKGAKQQRCVRLNVNAFGTVQLTGLNPAVVAFTLGSETDKTYKEIFLRVVETLQQR